MSNVVSLSEYKSMKRDKKKDIEILASQPLDFSDAELQAQLHEDEVRLMNGLDPKYNFRDIIRAKIQNAINDSDYSAKH